MAILRRTAAGALEAKPPLPPGCGIERCKLVAALPTTESEMIVRIGSATYWKAARASPMRSISSIIEA